MRTLLHSILGLALAPCASFITPDAPAAAAPAAALQVTQEQLAQMLADAAKAAVAAYSSRVAPVTSGGNGGRQVRLKHEVEPPHGAPVDRVGVVEGVVARVLHEGKEAEVLAVRFGDLVEQHVASALVGA